MHDLRATTQLIDPVDVNGGYANLTRRPNLTNVLDR